VTSAYYGQQNQPMRAPTDAELGKLARHALWRFSSTTALRDTARDKAGIALVRSHFPTSRDVFTDDQLTAVLQGTTGRPLLLGQPRGPTCQADTRAGRPAGPAVRPLSGQVRGREGRRPRASPLRRRRPASSHRGNRVHLAGRAGTDRHGRLSPGCCSPQRPALLPAPEAIVTRSSAPWGRWIDGDCRCDHRAPCLYHFDQALDWQGRAAALARAGVKPAVGR